MGSTLTKNRPGLVYASPRPIEALVLGCTDGAQEGNFFSLGLAPWYSRLKYMPLRLI